MNIFITFWSSWHCNCNPLSHCLISFHCSLTYNIHPVESWWSVKRSLASWWRNSPLWLNGGMDIFQRVGVIRNLFLQRIEGPNGRFREHGRLLSNFVVWLLQQRHAVIARPLLPRRRLLFGTLLLAAKETHPSGTNSIFLAEGLFVWMYIYLSMSMSMGGGGVGGNHNLGWTTTRFYFIFLELLDTHSITRMCLRAPVASASVSPYLTHIGIHNIFIPVQNKCSNSVARTQLIAKSDSQNRGDRFTAKPFPNALDDFLDSCSTSVDRICGHPTSTHNQHQVTMSMSMIKRLSIWTMVT